MSRKDVDRLIDNYAQEQGVASAIAEWMWNAEYGDDVPWEAIAPTSMQPSLYRAKARESINALTAAGFSIVRTEDIERISATWGPSLDQAAPVDLRIHERLREALGTTQAPTDAATAEDIEGNDPVSCKDDQPLQETDTPQTDGGEGE